MTPVRPFLRLLIVAGLGVDAYLHLRLAPTQQPAGSPGGWSQVDLFYAEGGVAILAAVLLLVTGRRWAHALAFLVAATALGALLLYRYVDVGALGPLPNMYEPAWYPTKLATATGAAVAVVAAAAGTVVGAGRGNRRRERDGARTPAV